ncbi:Circadian clock-controlled protein daywake [Pseudolycoriella hygida]|uniref:Circadian clock-controlled protein daywake n=1 Tax=Pseudolycoriella hygida TaxID=35572 RepID=A0A9Q0S2K6_9DIPT|nr:Circadian clock-controlled protein daywake [Pseudolycoriella hygida]
MFTIITKSCGWIIILLKLCSMVTGQASELTRIFENCHKLSPEFDSCIKSGFNKLRPLFKTGITEYSIAPFDPHHAEYVEQRRGLTQGVGGYRLLLSDVSEFGWTNSLVTKYKTDWENNRFIYSQDFPEKSLTGLYDFKATLLGRDIHRKGTWNMTLYNYAQTTSVTRIGGPGGLLKVRVEIDRLGDLKMKISDLFDRNKGIEQAADFLINNMWRPGFPFLKPLINELVSTAFTDIFNESFRYFPVDNFIKD